jgi:iron complex outermembrane recepter protein
MKKSSSFAAALSLGVSLAVLVTAMPVAAAAQDAAPTARREVQTVTVTARKREEADKDVPVSITTLSGQALAVAVSGGADITTLSAKVPSLVVESSFGRAFPRFYIRGLGNTDFDLNASQPVSLVYDEIVYENPILKGFPVFDTQSVEVLRGPQGTLFGRNTPAGVVKFASVKPSQTTSGYAKVGIRNLEGFDFEGAAGGSIGENTSARLSVQANRQGDWVSNRAPRTRFTELGGYEEYAARLQFRYQPNENLDVLFNVHLRRQDGNAQLFRANIIKAGTNDFAPGFDPKVVFFDGGQGNPQRINTQGAVLNIAYDFANGMTLTSVTGYEEADTYSRGDIDGGFGASFAPPFGPGFIPFPAESADGLSSLQQITQEVRLASDPANDLSWTVGAYYFKENANIDSFNYDTLGGGAQNGYAVQKQESESYALFGSVSYKASEKVTLTGGLRFSDDNKDFVARRLVSPFGAGALGPIRRNLGDSSFTGDASVVYALNADTNLFARVARGYRAPSIQGRVLFGNVVTTARSEYVTSFEAGLKSTFFDRRVRLDLTGFAYVVDDLQLTAIGGAGNFNQLLNADKANGQGFEVEGQFLPTDNLSLSGSLSYNKTEIDDANLEVGICGGGCTVTDPINARTGNARINGNSLPNAPEWIANFSAEYRIPLATGELFALTDWSFKGETNFFLYESKEFREDGYWEGGLRAGFRTADGKREIAVYGRNITDEVRRVGGIDFNNLTGFINAPRIFGLEGTLRY